MQKIPGMDGVQDHHDVLRVGIVLLHGDGVHGCRGDGCGARENSASCDGFNRGIVRDKGEQMLITDRAMEWFTGIMAGIVIVAASALFLYIR